jgi:hypothetical protein
MAKKTNAKRARARKTVKRSAPTGQTRAKTRASKSHAPRASGGNRNTARGKVPARAEHISVRMYNNILGDCFLIRIPSANRDVTILIDCGALQGMPDASNIIGEIAADVARTTDSHLDVLVVTHEHWDHLSGFSQAKDIFSKFKIDELWLAWTEDDKDPDAARVRARRRKTLGLLLTLDKHFGPVAAPEEDPEADETVRRTAQPDDLRELLAFTGEAPLGMAAASRMTTDEILIELKKLANKVRYFAPGADPIALPSNVPVQAYVLGPPKDDRLLLRSNPRKGEVYLRGETDELGAYLAAAIQLDKGRDTFDVDEQKAFEMAMPFDGHHMRALSKMEPPQGVDGSGYFLGRDAWRRIDRDWLGAAEQLALKLDSDTNNTSLVLAFVVGTGANRRVLLFPGDAQVGNWESWQQYIWPREAKRDDPAAIDITKLLASTVLYKVGHHASHNATLRAAGLELMTSPDLVAMIPVKEEFARKTKHWNMPFPSLLARLLEKTKGRVFRADKSLADLKAESAARAGKPGELTQADWNEFFARVSEGPPAENGNVPLFIEYSIPL